jgi:hypothetical protein
MVTGMTCTSDNKLLLSNCGNDNCIHVFDDNGQYLRDIPSSGVLSWDIAMIPGKNVAVATFASQGTCFFDVDRMREIKERKTRWGRAITVAQSDMLLLGSSSTILILDVEGKTQSSISFPDIEFESFPTIYTIPFLSVAIFCGVLRFSEEYLKTIVPSNLTQ